MSDAPLCDRLRASGSALELEAAEAIGRLVAHVALLEFKGAGARETCRQLEAENASLREELRKSKAIADELFEENATLEDDLEEIARAGM